MCKFKNILLLTVPALQKAIALIALVPTTKPCIDDIDVFKMKVVGKNNSLMKPE